MMISLKLFLVISALICSGCGSGHKDHSGHEQSGSKTETTQAQSPLRTAMAMIGSTHVHMEYSAPSVRGRAIWGELVPYHKIWVTGAHMATSLQFNSDLKIAGNVIPAGKYAFFTIPGEKEWTIIINKNWNQHQADDYNMADDAVRFMVTPEFLNEPVEELKFEVIQAGDKNGKIVFQWEKLKFSIDIESAG